MSVLVSDGPITEARPTDALVVDKLGAADVLGTFRALTYKDQERFLTWVAVATDEVGRQRRVDVLVMAMTLSGQNSN